MIYQTYEGLVASVLYSSLFGVMLGILCVFISVFINSIESVISLPKNVAFASKNTANLKSIFKFGISVSSSEGKAKLFLKDLIFILTSGISFSILLYISTDGVFRIYILAITVFFFVMCKKTIGKWLEFLIMKLLKFVYTALVIIVSIILIPLKWLLTNIYTLLLRPFGRVVKKKIFSKLKIKIPKLKKVKKIVQIDE